MNPNIESILEQGEKVNWQGVINRKVLITVLVIALVVVFGIGGWLFTKETIDFTSNGELKQLSGSLIGAIVIGIGLIW